MIESDRFLHQQALLDWVKFMRRLVEVFIKKLEIKADILNKMWKPLVCIVKPQCETTILEGN